MAKHPVVAYMHGVLDGSIPAGHLIKLAVQRHQRDLEEAPKRGFHFDRAAAQHAIDFFGFLKHSKGEWAGRTFVLEPWQQFIVWVLFGWKRADGTRRFRTGYIEIPRKNGKALDIDTPVATPMGWTRHEDLRPGDLVFGPDGAQVRVLAVTEPYAGECYEVIFSDGTSVIAHANHEWATGRTWFTKRRHGSRVSLPTVTTAELRKTLRCGSRGDLVHRIPVAGSLSLPDRELLIDPYVLGVWLGDGHTACARLTCADAGILTELACRGYQAEPNGENYSYLVGRGHFQVELRRIGLLGNKHIPDQYLRASKRQRLDLLRGLMDTDGYVSQAGQCELVLTNPRLFWGAVELMRSLGYKPTVKIDRATINGKDCGPRYRAQFWSFADEPATLLERKAARLKPRPKSRTRVGTRQIVAVEPVGERMVNCIQVEGDLYLAGQAMVTTHNSTLVAGIGLYLLTADGEPGAEVYSAATKRDQAKIVHAEATRMVKASPSLSRMVKVFKDNLNIPETASKYEPLGADQDTLDGLNVHGAIIDELHAHKGRGVVEVLETATGARRQPLQVEITTSGTDQTSICYEHHDYCEQILKGTIEDDTWFSFIATIDEGDKWDDPTVWAKANPNYGISVKPDDLARKAEKAKRLPAAQNAFKRLHLDVWTQQVDRWIDLALWDENAGVVDEESLRGRLCYGGLDLSSVSDITSWVKVFPHDDDPETVDIQCRFWCPEAKLTDDTNKYKAQYQMWANQGWLETTPGNAVDYGFVRAAILEDAQRFNIENLNVDRLFQGYQVSQELADEGLTVFGMGQGFMSMGPPVKEFERRLLGNKLHHGGNPVLRWMADNVAVRQDPAGNLKPDKAASQGKIDGIVSLIMALDRAMRHGPPKRSVYEDRGLEVC